MNFELFRKPIPYLIIKDVFPKQINKKILSEAILNKDKFKESVIGRGNVRSFRNNTVCYYDDDIYTGKRDKSFLLSAFAGLFINKKFREILSTSPYPICDFTLTGTHETQVSRYGSSQKYNWHQDRFDNKVRHITIVYYFFKEPKKWSGGKLLLTDSPAYEGELIEQKPNIVRIIPKNNMCIVFSSTGLHKVSNTKTTNKFADGRFSANIWIGFK